MKKQFFHVMRTLRIWSQQLSDVYIIVLSTVMLCVTLLVLMYLITRNVYLLTNFPQFSLLWTPQSDFFFCVSLGFICFVSFCFIFHILVRSHNIHL